MEVVNWIYQTIGSTSVQAPRVEKPPFFVVNSNACSIVIGLPSLDRDSNLFPKTSDSHFDMDYYLSKHVPMTKAKLQSLGFPVEAEVDEGIGSITPGEPAPYAAIGYLLFEKMEDLQNGLATYGAEIMADILNFTNVQPQIQIGNIVFGA